ncbi:gluconate 2-dehydrogenase subunit 3 family protein [Phenylobacterium sp. LjRoot219]|uniref:gluconate 2-dehydrogenase subunit 3 family protein n=1 Tax=Phenylobacterium sp. LjRoot219 TaxID=3342283 RepID=UPI003ED06248
MAKGVNRRVVAFGAAALPAVLPITGASAETIRGAVPWREGAAAAPPAVTDLEGYVYFTAAEAAFVAAATGRLIPADELGPGAVEAGVPLFLDRQLAGQYGHARRWYMQGPWAKGEKTQGYQLRMTPAELYRAAIAAIDQVVAQNDPRAAFANLAAADQDRLLGQLEKGQLALPGVDGQAFFQLLLQNTLEGFFSDPIYGGNRDMVGWKLIGFPGARYDNRPFVTRYGEPYPLPPVGISGRPDWQGRG